MPKYHILRMETIGTPPLMDRVGMALIFDVARDAADYAKAMSGPLGEKLCVKPVIDEGWRKREDAKFRSGEYRPLPWAGARWWTDAYAIWKDHYPHAALEKPGWIAYTKNEEDGTKDKQSLLRPGAYLNKYFEQHLHTYGVSERRCVEEFMKMYGPLDVHFATTEEEIIKVYEKGPQTCIGDKEWPRNIHPASIYAAGDLAIAYLGNIDGRISARGLVWPEKKLHSRLYGDIARLTQGLQRLGYVWGPPIGAKLKRIELRKPNINNGRMPAGCFIAPYIDKKNQAGGGHLSVMDSGNHLVICEEGTPGSHHGGNADGCTGLYVMREDEYPHFTCEKCGNEKARDLTPVYTEGPDDDNDGELGEYEQWCAQCCQRHSWHCRYSGQRFAVNIPWVEVAGNFWLPYYADMYAVRCDGEGRLYPSDDIRKVWMPDGTVKNYCLHWIRYHIGGVFNSHLTNRLYPKIEQTTIWDGIGKAYTCSKRELIHHGFQCDSCDSYWRLPHRHQPRDDDVLQCPLCFKHFKEYGKLLLSTRAENELKQHILPLIAAE